MWNVQRHDALRTYSFRPLQSDDLSAGTIVGLAEEATERDEGLAVALEALRSFVSVRAAVPSRPREGRMPSTIAFRRSSRFAFGRVERSKRSQVPRSGSHYENSTEASA